ncbi:ATP-binding protein [Cellvibrio sp. pealriver]|uniref:ATP-binding protein n=1 Tax=Cellvibrio sp. pealriver TaxID=1622269 RepID=UPI00066FC9A3|nr:ATP-binding protein [Cellvibrio sp. pealriver]
MNAFFSSQHLTRYATGLAIWGIGWCLLLLLDSHFDVANLGLVLVLISAIGALWLPLSLTLAISLVAVMAFNWNFVPPRGTFAIDLHQHAFLLLALVVVNLIVAGLMVSLREQTRRARAHAEAADALRRWGDQLRDTKAPVELLDELQKQLTQLSGFPVVMLIDSVSGTTHLSTDPAQLTREQSDALRHCKESNQAIGPGSGRYQELLNLYLPLRGKNQAGGAVMLDASLIQQHDVFAQAQALCDQMGAALERQKIVEDEQRARDQVQSQNLRNTFLAAISHDYRTPLATIMTSASSLIEQNERLSFEARQQLTQRILDEADRLRRQTSNMLQLARLDGIQAVGAAIKADWQSAEDIIGSVLQRIPADHQTQIETYIQTDLPLLWGDALLLTQLLENLIDNAIKYGPKEGAIKLIARVDQQMLVLAVEDQGRGIAQNDFEQLLENFQRGDHRQSGAGVGLALCRAIVRAHGGEFVHCITAQGACFECRLPVHTQPAISGEV